MGSEPSSLLNSPAGKSVVGKIYKTTKNMQLSCQGWSLESAELLPIRMAPREHTLQDQFCKNTCGFRILLKPGIKIQVLDFIRTVYFADTAYHMKFMILDDIELSGIIEYNDYIYKLGERDKISPNSAIFNWLTDDGLHTKGMTVVASPWDFFDIEIVSLPKTPITPSDTLEIVSKN